MLGDDLLTGEITRLTTLNREDLPAFARWMNSMALRRLLGPSPVLPITMDDENAWYNSIQRPEDRPFAIRALTDDRLLGNCGMKDIDWVSRRCMIGIFIGDEQDRGKGYGTDALNVLLRYIFQEMNLNRVGLEVYSYNTRARRSYEKLGFVLEGTIREGLLRDGAYHDILQMGILRREWLARQPMTPTIA